MRCRQVVDGTRIDGAAHIDVVWLGILDQLGTIALSCTLGEHAIHPLWVTSFPSRECRRCTSCTHLEQRSVQLVPGIKKAAISQRSGVRSSFLSVSYGRWRCCSSFLNPWSAPN